MGTSELKITGLVHSFRDFKNQCCSSDKKISSNWKYMMFLPGHKTMDNHGIFRRGFSSGFGKNFNFLNFTNKGSYNHLGIY